MLDDLPVGAEFQPGLLHITIIPWFVLETEESDFIKWYESEFSSFKPFEVEIGERRMFGFKRDVAVSVINHSSGFYELHEMAMNWFRDTGSRWAVRHPHVEHQYVPHIRRRRGTRLEHGKVMRINRLELIRARRQEDEQRFVAAKVHFK